MRTPAMPDRRLSFSALALLVVGLLSSGCVQFQTATLYDGFEPVAAPERPRTLALAVEPSIFADQNDDTVWFQDDANCTQGEVTSDVVYDGQRAVAVSWDRGAEGCKYRGERKNVIFLCSATPLPGAKDKFRLFFGGGDGNVGTAVVEVKAVP